MKIQEIFNLAIKMGVDADFRDNGSVEKMLARKKEKYDNLSIEQKKEFDEDSLINPYLDSRVLHIIEDKEIKKILVEKHDFSLERVEKQLEKLREVKEKSKQKGLNKWF